MWFAGPRSGRLLPYVRKIIADGEHRVGELTEQLKGLEIERTKVATDLKGWREIASLVAEKIGEPIAEDAKTNNGTAEPRNPRLDHEGVGDHRVTGEAHTASAKPGATATNGSDFSGKTHAQTAALALREIGKAATASEIRDKLSQMGHHINEDQKLAANILYNSMGRQPSVFRKSEGGYWELLEPNTRRLFTNEEINSI